MKGAESVRDEGEIELLRKLDDGGDMYDIFTSGLGDDLERLENANMVERPIRGEEKIKLTPLSRTYLQYLRKV